VPRGGELPAPAPPHVARPGEEVGGLELPYSTALVYGAVRFLSGIPPQPRSAWATALSQASVFRLMKKRRSGKGGCSMAQSGSIFRAPREVHFGPGVVDRVGRIVRAWADRALVVTGSRSARSSGALEAVLRSLAEAGVDAVVFDRVAQEPTLGLVDEARSLARKEGCRAVIGLGGGSPIDAAKCCAGLFYSSEPATAHFEGRAEIPERSLPWIGVPTTAGAGARSEERRVGTEWGAGRRCDTV